ncbi:flavin reductase [Pasteurella testudinis]|nr:flavin reductase [Pasteurella testudinis]
MAHLASAVSILTSGGAAGTIGLTVSSVTSVTDTPATLLVCINQGSEVHDIIKQNGKVTVNILNAQQQDLALHFAALADSTMAERLAWDMWQEGENGVPHLQDALVNLQGRIVADHQVGTHSVFFVEIDAVRIQSGEALLYFNRTFKAVAL